MDRVRKHLVGGGIGIGVAGLVLALGLVMTSNADFSDRYVRSQLAEQKITFKPAAQMTEAELASPCVRANAGKPVLTGKQAECFANEYIALHLADLGDGRTYAEWGADQLALEAQMKTARGAALAELQEEHAAVLRTRQLLFTGETLRGMLLTSFGFSTLGEKGAQAATAAYVGAAVIAVIALFFLARGLVLGLPSRRRAYRPSGAAPQAA
jgi:hypothetical protein